MIIFRISTYSHCVGLRIESKYILAIGDDGCCILVRLPHSLTDHILSLLGAQPTLDGLARQNHANLSREVARMFSIADIDHR